MAPLKVAPPVNVNRAIFDRQTHMKNGKASQVVVENPEQAFRKFEGALRQSLTVSKNEVLRREKSLAK